VLALLAPSLVAALALAALLVPAREGKGASRVVVLVLVAVVVVVVAVVVVGQCLGGDTSLTTGPSVVVIIIICGVRC